MGPGRQPTVVTAEQLLALDLGWSEPETRPVCLVDLSTPVSDPGAIGPLTQLLRLIPCVTIGVNRPDPSVENLRRYFDLMFETADPLLERALTTIYSSPCASITLAILLRNQASLDQHSGILMESVSYSTLQAGREFISWRRDNPSTRPSASRSHRAKVFLTDESIDIVLDRPERHNAIDRQMRKELYDAFLVASMRKEQVRIFGLGPSFSSGGDLHEFGSFTDPAAAHLVRMASHPAVAMLSVDRQRLNAYVHGFCLGGGLELAAFAGRLEAHPATVFGLPETRLGLLPGSGGTVSLPARIGARRVLELSLCHETIDAPTALEWGLIDAIR